MNYGLEIMGQAGGRKPFTTGDTEEHGESTERFIAEERGEHIGDLDPSDGRLVQNRDWEVVRERRIYRGRTVAMLRKYMRYSMDVGRLPSLVGREFFRS